MQGGEELSRGQDSRLDRANEEKATALGEEANLTAVSDSSELQRLNGSIVPYAEPGSEDHHPVRCTPFANS